MVVLAAVLAWPAWAAAVAGTPETAIRITSPLGRTGVPGVVRVVAQVTTPVPDGIVRVRFYVDDTLLGEDTDGPPYVSEWEDANPYEPRVIRAEVDDGLGGTVADRVSLASLEVIEEAAVSSVLVEATVTDEAGRYVSNLDDEHFTLFEDDEPQKLDLVQLQTLPTTFTLLVDGSQSMSRRIDLVRATARRLASRLRKGDMVVVAPFRRRIEAVTGPTNDAQTIGDAISGIRAVGGTAILDSLATLPDHFARAEGRQVVVLVTDGYDEHSSTSMEEAFRALQRVQATVYVVGIGGVAGHLAQGRDAAPQGGRADGRAGVLPVQGRAAARRARAHRDGSLQPVCDHLHAHQPGVGRRVSRHPARGGRAVVHGEGPTRVLCPGPAADSADARVQRRWRQ
jgi:Mg-chelatase subunit ChlD